jgi:PhnB protein
MLIPPGFNTVTPYFFAKNAANFVDFLVEAFDGVEVLRHLRDDGHIANAQVRIGTSTVMVSESAANLPALSASYYLYVENAEAAMARAIKAGAVEIMPVRDMPYGDRQGGVKDPHGNLWWVSQRLKHGPY